jgi:hypothetical protein
MLVDDLGVSDRAQRDDGDQQGPALLGGGAARPAVCYSQRMTTVQDIADAVAKLPPEDLATFRG